MAKLPAATRESFYGVSVSDKTIAAMSRTLGAVGVPGLRKWFNSLDREFVRDICAAYRLQMREEFARLADRIPPEGEEADESLRNPNR